MLIYLIVNHETGKYYVGQHKGKNLRKYLQTKMSAARKHSGNSYLFNSMRKYPQSSVWSIHALRSDIQDREGLDETERDFIKFLKAQDPEYGYNICRGGEGFTGPYSEETRKKMSTHSKQMWNNPEFHIKQSETMKQGWSNEKRSTQAEILKRRWSDPDYKGRLSKIQQDAWSNPILVLKQSETHKIIWSDSEKLAERGKKVSEALSKPEEQTRRAMVAKNRWAKSDYRAKMSEMSKKLWSNPDYRIKMAKRKRKSVL